MAIIAPKKEMQSNPVPEGSHIARVYQIIHIGTIDELYMGEPKISNKVRVTFELPNETKEFKQGEGERPYSISREFTLSMHEKSNLRPFVEGIIGKLTDEEAEAFDIADLMGKPCLLHIGHQISKTSGKPYAKIISAAPVPKGMLVPDAVNKPFLLDYDNFTWERFNELPGFLKEKMEQSQEYRKVARVADVGEEISKDVPF